MPRYNKVVITLDDAADQTSCRLLALPAELRNQIYEMVFSDTVIVPNIRAATPKGRARTPGLLLACRQTYSEALTIYYTRSIFQFSALSRFGKWIRKMGLERQQQIQLIRFAESGWLCEGDSTLPREYTGERDVMRAGQHAKYFRHWASFEVKCARAVFPGSKIHVPISAPDRVFWVSQPNEWLQRFLERMRDIQTKNPGMDQMVAYKCCLEETGRLAEKGED